MKIDHDRTQAIEKNVFESFNKANPEKVKNILQFIEMMIPKEKFTTYQVELFSFFENTNWPNTHAGHTYFPVEKYYSLDKTKAWFYFYDIERIQSDFFHECHWTQGGKNFFQVPKILFRFKRFFSSVPEQDQDQFLYCLFCQSVDAGGFKNLPGAIILLFYLSVLSEKKQISVDIIIEDESMKLLLKLNGKAVESSIPFYVFRGEEISGLKQISNLKRFPMYGIRGPDIFSITPEDNKNGVSFLIEKANISIPEYRENNFIKWFFSKVKIFLWRKRNSKKGV